VKDLLRANVLARRAQALAKAKLRWAPQVNVSDCVIVEASDAAWANRKNDKSSEGCLVLLASRSILKAASGAAGHSHSTKTGKAGLVPISLAMHKNGRIKRVCRSILASECYSSRRRCTRRCPGLRIVATIAGTPWHRPLMPRHCSTTSRVTRATGKRLSVEMNMLRQEVDEEGVAIRWLPTKQMVAGPFTKSMHLSESPMTHMRQVLDSNLRSLGPDPRAPLELTQRSYVQSWLKGNMETDAEAAKFSEEFVMSLQHDEETFPTARRGRRRAAH
jgi:hypothetical protein